MALARGAGVGAAILASLAVAVATAPVEVDGDRLTVRVEHRGVSDVIRDIATAAGAELHGQVVTERSVSLTLERVPLEEALQRLLGTQSFVVRYGEGGRAKAIVLRGEAVETPVVAARPPAAGVPTAPPVPAFPLELGRLFDRHRPIALNEPLAQALGQERASMSRLLDAAMTEGDGVTRLLASQAVLSALERGGRYRRSFLRTLHRLEPAQMDAIATGANAGRFEALLEYLATQSREPTLQKKAGVVLEQYRAVAAD